MIVSLRSPKLVRSPMPPEVALPGLVQAPLSEPVSKKFLASRFSVLKSQSVPSGEPSSLEFGLVGLSSVTTSR